MQGTILDTENSALKKKYKALMKLLFQWGRLANTQIIHVTKAEHNECYEEKEH